MKRVRRFLQASTRPTRSHSIPVRPAALGHDDETAEPGESDADRAPLLRPSTPPSSSEDTDPEMQVRSPRRKLTRTSRSRSLEKLLSPDDQKVREIRVTLQDTRAQLRQNVDEVFARGERLVEIEDTTEFIAATATDLHTNARGLRRAELWRKWRVCVVLGVLVLLTILGLVAYGIWLAVASSDTAPLPPPPVNATQPLPRPPEPSPSADAAN